MYVEVLTQISAKAVDQYYVYSVPEVFRNNIKIGIRVRIPFGKMELEGFVMNILNDTDYDKSKIRDISDVVDDRPVLNKEMILLGKYMSKHLLCSLVSAYQVMLPKALKAKKPSYFKRTCPGNKSKLNLRKIRTTRPLRANLGVMNPNLGVLN